MAGDSTAIKVDSAALGDAATFVRQQHDTSAQDLQTTLTNLENQLQQLAQYVPNIIDHVRGEHTTIGKRGTTLLGLFSALADGLDNTANEADPLRHRAALRMRQIE